MELPTLSAAATRMARVLSDDRVESLHLSPSHVGSMGSWTEQERTAVMNAARDNRSLERLDVNFERLTEETAETFASISSQLSHVKDVAVAVEGADSPFGTDELLYGFMKSRSLVSELRLCGCSSPGAFLDFCERFPHLERLTIAGQVSSVTSASRDEFAKAVAASIGQLSLLRVVGLDCDGLGLSTLRLLLALESSATSKTLCLQASECSKELLVDASRFCCISTTVKRVALFGKQLLDISSFLDNGSQRPFSRFLKDMQFFHFNARRLRGHRLDSVAGAMQNVERLAFGMCHFPAADLFEFLKKLPLLKSLVCLARGSCVQLEETFEDEFNDATSTLSTNADLEGLCNLIEMKGSLVCNVCLDMVSRVYRPLPAIVRLLRGCKGSLTLNLARLPKADCASILAGAYCVRECLKTLRLRFHRCQFDDESYAAILRAFGSIRTLSEFELGFDTRAKLRTPKLSIAVVHHLIERNNTLVKLSLRGLSNGATAALLESIVPLLATANRSLRILRLQADLTSYPHVLQPILDMLIRNQVLVAVEGCKFPKDNPLAAQIRHLLKQNSCGRSLLHGGRFTLSGAPAPMAMWCSVLARESVRDDPQLMYAFLRAKPDLVQPNVAPVVVRRSRRIKEMAEAMRRRGNLNLSTAPQGKPRQPRSMSMDPSHDGIPRDPVPSGRRRKSYERSGTPAPCQGGLGHKRTRLSK